jgi:hypothetical protein
MLNMQNKRRECKEEMKIKYGKIMDKTKTYDQ